MRPIAFVLFCGCLLLSCHSSDPSNAVFEAVSPEKSGIRFENKVENTEDFNIFSYRNFYNGGGVAIGDLNNDGLADVYLTSNMGYNKLFLNKGNFQFEDITDKAGVAGKKFWSTGVSLVDINADGFLDIYVCNAGYKKDEKPENELFINNGNLTFTEKAAEYGLNEDGYTTHAAFFDYDLDGDLDCYILNNSFMPVNTLNYSNNRELYAEDWPVKDFLKGGGDKLLRNDGGKFTNVTRQAGIFGSLIGFGLGVTVGDVNGDRWPDLYISNDFFERDYLYINQQNGTFKEEVEQWMEHLSHASMGADMADINNDGYPEIFTTEMLPSDDARLKTMIAFENYNVYQLKLQRGFYHQYMQNCLQLNNGNRTFSEIANYAGVAASDWSWGALMFDADNDGYRDIYVCNGIYKDVIDQDFMDFFADEIIQKMALTGKKAQINEIIDKMPSTPLLNKFYHNTGNLKFDDCGLTWGFYKASFSNGAAYGDLDNDGDLDLVVNNVNQEAFVYRNRSDKLLKNKALTVQLKGKGTNSYAIGSKVTVYAGNQRHTAELFPSRGFQSSVDYKMIFGLGNAAAPDSIAVEWPDRTRTVMSGANAGTLIQIDWQQQPGMADPGEQAGQSPTLFSERQSPFPAVEEDDFIDFYKEGLTYRLLSREGPKAAMADVDGDGMQDVFIGAPAGKAGMLYRQTASGFKPVPQACFETDTAFEDTAVLFFDADGDGDPDLFVGSGGNKGEPGSRLLQDRLYLNDGKGRFSASPDALSPNGFNTAVAVPWDFDADGDLDLFVGSRSVPGIYGVLPRHYLYENDGKGHFKDVAKTKAEAFKRLGMVTDAILADVCPEPGPELVVVGEWMSPEVYGVSNGGIKKIDTNLDQYPGWWYAVSSVDVDGDGDQDLVLGNRGENFYFTGNDAAPVKIWVWDFDGNGDVEKIMTRKINGKDMPIPMKKDLTAQVPSLKKNNLKHTEYAKKAIQDLFPPAALKQAMVRTATWFPSSVALNQGNHQFVMTPLPDPVQFSCVKAIWSGDLNGDAKPDLLLAGNDAGFMPQFSKLDASFGHTLLNRGNGAFDVVPNKQSGFTLRGDVKQLLTVPDGKEKWIMALVNGRQPRLFQLNATKPDL